MASAVPIKPSRMAWSELSDNVREGARLGFAPDDYADAVAVVAYGRYRMRVAIGLSLVAGALFYVFVYGVLGSSSNTMSGWMLAAAAVGLSLNIAVAMMSRLTVRLIRTGMVRVMEQPVRKAPATLSIDGRGSLVMALTGIGSGAMLTATAILIRPPGALAIDVIGQVLFLAGCLIAGQYFGTGRSAEIDETGIRLGRPAMHIPWTSIDAMSVELSSVAIMITGPVSPIDRAGRRWNGRRHAWPDRRTTVSIATKYPEMVKWVARAYTEVAETDEAVLARAIPIRAASSGNDVAETDAAIRTRPTVRRTTRRYVAR